MSGQVETKEADMAVKEVNWGGQAFPTEGGVDSGLYPDPGMSLRDWFAGQALAGLPEHLKVLQTDHRIKIAEWTYGLADAMLAEREKDND